MNKKNEKGFTLVELVVVIALLTVMMGAILQLMGPIRQVYNTTLNTVNTKTAGETIIGYIEDKTRYATDMLVLKNYEGVPQISPIGTSETFKVGACSAPFTECIIVDNNHLRDEMFADFSNDTLTSRKNCRGTVYTLKDLGGKDYLDLTKAKAGSIGNNVYGPYSYHTNIFLEENKFKYDLLVDVESYAMEFQNNAYVEAAGSITLPGGHTYLVIGYLAMTNSTNGTTNRRIQFFNKTNATALNAESRFVATQDWGTLQILQIFETSVDTALTVRGSASRPTTTIPTAWIRAVCIA